MNFLLSAVLILFMTLSGLTLFCGREVCAKNVLSIMAWCFGISGLVTAAWWAFGYSLVFGTSFRSPSLAAASISFFEAERDGLDQSHRGEHGYIFDLSSI